MEVACAAAGGSASPSATATTRRFSLTSPSRRYVLPHRSPRRSCSSLRLVSDSNRFNSIQIRASEETTSPIEVGDMFADLKEKWDAIEDKSLVFLYGGGTIVAVWLLSTVVDAINSLPMLPKVMELVGLGYTGWFVYRYLLFKSSRKELANDIEALKEKIAGSE